MKWKVLSSKKETSFKICKVLSLFLVIVLLRTVTSFTFCWDLLKEKTSLIFWEKSVSWLTKCQLFTLDVWFWQSSTYIQKISSTETWNQKMQLLTKRDTLLWLTWVRQRCWMNKTVTELSQLLVLLITWLHK